MKKRYSMIVFFILFLILRSDFIFASRNNIRIDSDIVALIESQGCSSKCIGDGGKAIGPHQIHAPVVKAFNIKNGTHYKHSDLFNKKISTKIADWYLNQEIPRLIKHYSQKNKKIKDTTESRLIAYNAGIYSLIVGRTPKITQAYLYKYKRFQQLKTGGSK